MIDPRIKRNPVVQEKLRQLVVDNKSAIANHNRTILERRLNSFYDIYRGLKKGGSYKGRANLDWASAFISIEIILPRLYRALFPRGKWFGTIGQENTDRKQAAIIESYMKSRFEHPIRIRTKMIP